MSPRTHVSRRLLPPIFLPNVGHNQSASRIIAFTFLTENVSNESAFFVQRAHPYRAFLHKYIRAEGQLNGTAILRNHTRTKFTASATTGGSTILVLEPMEQSTYSLNYRAVTTSFYSCQLALGTTEQPVIGSLYQLNIQAILSQFEYSQPQDIFEDVRVIFFFVTCILCST